ncbi:MAG: hypothetical protein M1115_08185 [Actinobacteria bacterium]|nr:hypothetical protein [Actinomycetota bacterium]
MPRPRAGRDGGKAHLLAVASSQGGIGYLSELMIQAKMARKKKAGIVAVASEAEEVLYEDHDGVARVTINRPERHNEFHVLGRGGGVARRL